MSRGLMVVDGSNLFARAYYTLPPRVQQDGEQWRPALAARVRTMLAGLVQRHRPLHLLLALDSPTPSFRYALLPGYKGDRSRNGPGTRELTDALRLHFLEWGVATREAEAMEADDVVATIAARTVELGMAVQVVSKDTDLLQLVGDNWDVTVLWPDGGGELVHREHDVHARTSVWPEQLLDFRVLSGGKDNLPRVGWTREQVAEHGYRAPHGITERRAAQLLEASGTLEALYGSHWGILTPREQEWFTACADDADRRREALRLRFSLELTGNGAASHVAQLRLATPAEVAA